MFDPTSAFARSCSLAALLIIAAIVVKRADLVLLAVPFIVHAAWGWWRRPAGLSDQPVGSAAPHLLSARVSPQRLGIAEDQAAELCVALERAEPGHWLSVQWPGLAGVTWRPTFGAVLAPHSQVSVAVEPARWGRYEFTRPSVQVVDDSGSWRAQLSAEAPTLLVRPEAETLTGDSGVARPIGLTGSHDSSQRGDGSQLADIRPYRTGDRLRRINWRVSSRTRDLHVTTTFTERDTDVLIVTDTLRDLPDPAATRHRRASTSLDATVRAVTAIAQHYLAFGDRVGVHDLGRRLPPLRPGTGARQLRRIIEALARMGGDLPPHLALRPVGSVRSGTLVFCCSPLLDERVITQVVHLRQLGAEVIVVDTWPSALGTVGALDSRPTTFMSEAWLLRRLQRAELIAGLEGLGIPVVAWQGPSSLASVLLAMRAARRAPRSRVGR